MSENVIPITQNMVPPEEEVCAEIEYFDHEREGWVHSDICPEQHLLSEVADMEQYKLLLHQCLDEWLDRSNGTGHFLIGSSSSITEEA